MITLDYAQTFVFGYLVGLLCVLVPLFFAVTAPTVFRARRKRRLPTPQPRQREDALPTRADVVTWGGAASRERWWTEN